MADSKITGLTELEATPESTDLVYIVDDPDGTPVSKSITVSNLLGSLKTYVFAASDSSDKDKAKADVLVADGSLATEIMTVITALGTGGALYFLKGTYTWDGSVTLDSTHYGYKIYGELAHSTGTVFKPADNNTDDLFVYSDTGVVAGIMIQDIYFEGNKSGSANCSIINSGSSSGYIKDIFISHVVVFNFSTDTVFNIFCWWGLVFTDSIIEDCEGDVIVITTGSGGKISNNKIQNNVGAAISIQGASAAVNKSIITGNELGTITASQGVIELNGDTVYITHVLIENNIIHNHLNSNAIYGIHATGNVSRNSFLGNTFYADDSGGMGIGIYLEDTTTDRNLINNNTFNTNVAIPIQDDSTNGNFIGSSNSQVGTSIIKKRVALTPHGTLNCNDGSAFSITMPVYNYDASATEIAMFSTPVPDDWNVGTTIDVKFTFHNASAQTGDTAVVWCGNVGVTTLSGVQSAPSAVSSITTNLNSDAPQYTNITVTFNTIASSSLSKGGNITVRLYRTGGDAADTMTGDAAVYLPWIEYQPGKCTLG